jgi:hypothetical protein
MRRRVPLPRGWSRHTKSAIVQILALSHCAFTAVVARAARSRNTTTRLRGRDRPPRARAGPSTGGAADQVCPDGAGPAAATSPLSAAGTDGDHGASGRSRLVGAADRPAAPRDDDDPGELEGPHRRRRAAGALADGRAGQQVPRPGALYRPSVEGALPTAREGETPNPPHRSP